MGFKGRAAIWIGLSASVLASPVAAQQTEELPEQAGGLDDIVVTARRTSENVQDVPIAITTISAQQLSDYNVQDIYDVQKLSPGLYMTTPKVSGRVKLTIRGQTETDDGLIADRSVGFYVDGVNWERNYGLRASLVDIDRIEVLKGPQGTLFGKNTTGGALNITTKRPVYDFEGYGDLTAGSFDNLQLLGVVNVPLVHDKLAVRLVGQRISRKGFYPEFNGRSNDNHSWNGRALVRFDPTDNVKILLSADYVRIRNGGVHLVPTFDAMLANANTPTRALGAIAAQLGLNPASAADRMTAYNAWRVYYDAQQNGGGFKRGFSDAVDPKDNLDHYGFAGTAEIDLGGVTAKSISSYRRLKRAISLDYDTTPFDLFQTRQQTDAENVSQELQLISIDNLGLDWQAGLYYNRESGQDESLRDLYPLVSTARAGITGGGVINSTRAAYAQAVYNFSPAWRVTAGIRYTSDKRVLDSRNRIDPTQALEPFPPASVARCNLLAPALGGPVFPNCSYKVSTSSDKVTWLLSADWRPNSDVMVYGSVSTGYRAGGFTQPGGSVIASVAELDAAFTPFLPETVTNYELGLKSELLDRKLRVNAAIYYQDYRDIQKQIRDEFNGIFVTLIRNAGKATIYGGELEIAAAPTSNLDLHAGVAYLHARYDEFLTRDPSGNFLDLTDQPFAAPKWTYNLGGSYTVPLNHGALQFSLNYAHVGTTNYSPGTPAADSVTQEGYGLVDACISWSIESADVDIALFGRNLANKKYLDSGTNVQSLGWNLGNPGDPRTLGVQIRKRF